MKDFDFDEIDKAINDAIADEAPAKSKSAPKSPTNPADKFVDRKALAPKPEPKPAPRPVAKPVAKPATKPVTKTVAPPKPIKRQGMYFDVIPASRRPAVARPAEDDEVETTFISQVTTTTTITTLPEPIDNIVAREQLAEDEFVREPEPLNFAPDTPVQVRPVRFVDNIHIEKRPLSNSLPPDHTDNITSTRNIYSHATVTSTENRADKKRRSKKPARIKVQSEKSNKGNGLALAIVIALIVVLGAAAGYLLYLLLAN